MLRRSARCPKRRIHLPAPAPGSRGQLKALETRLSVVGKVTKAKKLEIKSLKTKLIADQEELQALEEAKADLLAQKRRLAH